MAISPDTSKTPPPRRIWGPIILGLLATSLAFIPSVLLFLIIIVRLAGERGGEIPHMDIPMPMLVALAVFVFWPYAAIFALANSLAQHGLARIGFTGYAWAALGGVLCALGIGYLWVFLEFAYEMPAPIPILFALALALAGSAMGCLYRRLAR